MATSTKVWASPVLEYFEAIESVVTDSCRQFQEIVESLVMVNMSVFVPEPEEGAEPVPVQPVQIQLVPPSLTGLVTLQVIELPELYFCWPMLGFGFP